MPTPAAVAAPLAADADLANATDAELDAGLMRLYRLHYDAQLPDRDAWHAAIMAVVCEQGRRLDVWLDAV